MNYLRTAIELEAPEELPFPIRHNLSESAISDQTLASLGITIPPSLCLTYPPHTGSLPIRAHVASSSGGTLTAEDVLVTSGASTALFIVMTALLRKDDHVVVVRPNYAMNVEVPRAIGCEVTCVDLEFGEGWRVDLGRVGAAVQKGRTKLISVCSPNNPTGTVCSGAELRGLAALAKEAGGWLLVDETYSALVDYDSDASGVGMAGEMIPPAASLGAHVIGVSSMSKAYGVPGIRIGWLTATDSVLKEKFLAAKEQICISGSVLDELVAEQVLAQSKELLARTAADVRRRRDRVARWVEEEREWVEWVRPEAGVMCFVRLKRVPEGGAAAFYKTLLERHGVYVGPGRWFECEERLFRLGYGWPTWEDLEGGLDAISKALREG